jgi:MFS family permease
MQRFLLVWLSQAVSSIGSRLTTFGLAVWFFQRTGSATGYGLISAMAALPSALVVPLAGVLVDRWDRRRLMLGSHASAGLCSLLIAALFAANALEVGRILPFIALASCFNTIQLLTFTAVTSTLVPAESLSRANGYTQFGASLSQIIAPAAAGFLLPAVGLGGILLIDAGSFLFAIAILLAVRFPRPAITRPAAGGAQGSLFTQAMFGWRYIRSQSALQKLLLLTVVVNFNFGIFEVLITPLVLGFADTRILGVVMAASGLGILLGSAVLVVWGVTRQYARAVAAAALLQGLSLCVCAARPSAILAVAGAFGAFFSLPFISGLGQTLWQRSTPADIQGRVFSFRIIISGASLPLGFAVAGPIAEKGFEPLMRPGGLLSSSAGRLLGVGPGRGVALLFVLLGGLTAAVMARLWASPKLLAPEDAPADEKPAGG